MAWIMEQDYLKCGCPHDDAFKDYSALTLWSNGHGEAKRWFCQRCGAYTDVKWLVKNDNQPMIYNSGKISDWLKRHPRYVVRRLPGQMVGYDYVVTDKWADTDVYSSDTEALSIAECARRNALAS